MKRFGKLFGLVALVAIMGLGFMSCDSGSSPTNVSTTPSDGWPVLHGTWVRGGDTITFAAAPNEGEAFPAFRHRRVTLTTDLIPDAPVILAVFSVTGEAPHGRMSLPANLNAFVLSHNRSNYEATEDTFTITVTQAQQTHGFGALAGTWTRVVP